MGSGKSTLGRALAESLAYDFLDTDDFIAQKEGRSISNIFRIEGEEYFREQEKKALLKLLKRKKTVVATGGGLPCFLENMLMIKENGLSFFLEMEAEYLLERLKNEKEHRPLLDEKDDEILLLWMKKKIKEREEFYQQADFILDGGKDIEELVSEINSKIISS